MLCHNCGKENPADSKFCNNCGARLAGSPAPAGGHSSEPTDQPDQPSGETEGWDWSDGVPDWLTGGEAADEQRLLGADEDRDLPTWLLDDEGTAPESGSAAAEDDSASASEQELPEWLRGLAPKGTGPLPSSRDKIEDQSPRPSLDDWLADLDSPEAAEQSPSWLADIEAEKADEASPVEGWTGALQGSFDDAGDWLGDLDIGEYGPPAAEASEDTWGSAGQSGFDMDAWLSELEPAEEQPEADVPEPPAAEADVEDTAIPDWLAGDVEAAPPSEPARFDALEAIPDWLADLEADAQDAAVSEPAETFADEGELAGEPAGEGPDEAPMSGSADDWLTSLEDDWREERADTGEVAVPDWPIDDEPSGAPQRGLTDWLEDTIPSAEDEGEEAAESEAEPGEAPGLDWWPAGEEAPDWLMVSDTPEETGEATGEADEESDWLSELDAAIGELEAVSQEGAPGIAGEAGQEPAGRVEDQETGVEEEGAAESDVAAKADMLPSWLAETELRAHLDEAYFEPLDEPETEASAGDAAEEVPEASEPAGGVPDWLAELEPTTPAPELADEIALPDWLQEAAPAGPSPEEEAATTEEPEFEAVPEEDGKEGALPEWLAAVTMPGVDEVSEPAAYEQPDEAETWPFEDEAGEGSPEIDAILSREGDDEDEIVGADELPDWLGDVTGVGDEELPAYLEDAEAVPGVIAGPDLPGWLEDSLPDEERAEPTPPEELPPWLVPPVGAEASQPELLSEVEESGEWTDVLGDLAESEASGAELRAAEIPEWLEALRPQEELRASEPPDDAEPVAEGPLAGLRGAVPVMPVVAEARSAEYAGMPEASTEQQEQADLLRQLVRQEGEQEARVVAGAALRARPSPWLRLVLMVLLFAAVLTGLFLPELVDVETVPVVPVAPAIEVLEAASGRPVLVVFDYSPAYAGILNDQASVLLHALAAQGSPVVYASQSAAGLGLGKAAVEAVDGLQAERLGYIAGETVGLRRLARCLGAELPGAAACEAYPPGTGDAAAILLLTGERDSLVDWIEQVETVGEAPLVAGVTEALVPVAAPYYATGQLDGIFAGQAATAAVAAASGVQTDEAPVLPLALAAWLAAALLLAGNIVFFFIGLVGSRRTRKA